jgi:hypothetical protein
MAKKQKKAAKPARAAKPKGRRSKAIDMQSWAHISDLALRHKAIKVRIGDLNTKRLDLAKQIEEEGHRKTAKRDRLCADHYDTVEQWEAAKGRRKVLADKLEKAIDDVNQGKIAGVLDEPEEKPAKKKAAKDDAKQGDMFEGSENGQAEAAGAVG